jgi:opacity protein-like surface antigen
MKKAVMMVVAAALMTGPASAQMPQKPFSIIGSIGYGFGVGGYYVGSLNKYANTVLVEKNDQYLNYGHGLKIEAGVHYLLMEHLGCQAVLSYTAGVPPIQVTNIPAGLETETYSRNTFGIKALLVPRVQVLDLFDVYAGFGMGLFFGWLSWERASSPYKGEYKTNPGFAFCGSLGAEYPVIRELIVFAEIAIEQMNFTVTRSRGTESSLETVYEQNSTAPNIFAPPKVPGSNVALRAGVRFPIF